MDNSKDIICPDCELEKVSQEYFKAKGKCIRCYKREIMASNAGREYIKFKDLSDSEKAKVIKVRERNLASTKYSNNEFLHNFLKNNSNYTLKELLVNIKEKVKGCENISEPTLRKIIERNGYKFKHNPANNIKKFNETRKRKSSLEASDRNTVFTQDVLDTIISLNTTEMNIREIVKILNDKFPDRPITVSNLCTKLSRCNIPYKKLRTRNKNTKNLINTENIDILETNNNVDINVDTETSITMRDITTEGYDEDNIISENVTHTMNTNNIDEAVEVRLQPIKDEVETNLETKFKQLNCNLEHNYTTQEYINVLQLLQYLVENYNDIIRIRKDQHDVANAYQQDVIHEMENTLAQPGDTYLSDKMHVLRDARRYYEYDSRDVTILRPLLEKMDIKLVTHIKELLEEQVEKRDNIRFNPMVDAHLVHKYDWATNEVSDNPLKRKKILRTNNYSSYKSLYEINMNGNGNKKAKKVRVSCRISGGGYGTFKLWYKDYLVTTNNMALTMAKKDLKELAFQYPGMMYTGLQYHIVNSK